MFMLKIIVSNCREGTSTPHIMNIHRLWKDSSGNKWLYGGWFYRIAETVHSATRKFLDQVGVL